MFEITARTTFPYRAITYIAVDWPNGSRTAGSGVVVGQNDVLTAMHVVFNSDRGGWASTVTIYPGADTKPSLVTPFGAFGNGWRISTRTTDWDADGDGLLSDNEAQYDLALIGLYERIGDTTGWLGSRSERVDGAATMLGYPSRGTGMMAENVYADASDRWGVFDIDSGLGAGSSGGPLVRTDADGEVYVVGVASSGDAADTVATYAALFGPGNWDWYTTAMADNDDLLGSGSGGGSGGAGGGSGGGGGGGSAGVEAPLFLVRAYLAYFGRPVDATGVQFFASRSEGEVAAAFDASRESQDLYGLSLPLKINSIYHNLFNRDAEPAGLQYWNTLVATGRISAPAAALEILKGAQGSDAAAVQNKLAASSAFTQALDTPAEVAGYAGMAAALSARAFVAAVDGSAASLTRALGRVDAAVAAAVSAGTSARSGLAADFADGEAPGVAWWGTDGADAVVALVGVPDAPWLWSADAGA